MLLKCKLPIVNFLTKSTVGKGGEKRKKEKKRNKSMSAPHQQRHHLVSRDKRKPRITNSASDHLRKMIVGI